MGWQDAADCLTQNISVIRQARFKPPTMLVSNVDIMPLSEVTEGLTTPRPRAPQRLPAPGQKKRARQAEGLWKAYPGMAWALKRKDEAEGEEDEGLKTAVAQSRSRSRSRAAVTCLQSWKWTRIRPLRRSSQG